MGTEEGKKGEEEETERDTEKVLISQSLCFDFHMSLV